MGTTFVIEHMEPDENTSQKLPPWVQLEYTQMLSLAGPQSTVSFTHLSQAASTELTAAFSSTISSADSKAKAYVTTDSVSDMMQKEGVSLDRVCLLDPQAKDQLVPEDADGGFEWFLFGGILGDDPPRDRTSELRKLGFPTRHLGSVQMTTDTAVGVTKLVVLDKVPLDSIPYIDYPTIQFNARESVEMPFRYIKRNGLPVLPDGMKELLHEDLNKSFDF